MKKTLILFVIGLTALLMSSCAINKSGTFASSASLSTNNFRYVKNNVKGTSTAIYVFGFGGRRSLANKAKEDLYLQNPLKNNQAFVNITVDHGILFTPVIFLGKCTVTADIVEFGK